MAELNLIQKLIEVRKEVPYLEKAAKGYGYNYTAESDVLGKITGKLNELGVLVYPSITDYDIIVDRYRKKTIVKEKELEKDVELRVFHAKATMVFINAEKPEEKLEIPFPIMGEQSDISQAFGSALTYCFGRYFFIKFNLIATDKDDPDMRELKIERAEALKEIKQTLSAAFKPKDHAKKKYILALAFGTSMWTSIKEKPLDELNAAFVKIEKILSDPKNLEILKGDDWEKIVVPETKNGDVEKKDESGGGGIIDDVNKGVNELEKNREIIKAFKPKIMKKFGNIFKYLETLRTTTKNQKLKSSDEIKSIIEQKKCIAALQFILDGVDSKTPDTKETDKFISKVNTFIPGLTNDGISWVIKKFAKEKKYTAETPDEIKPEHRVELLEQLEIKEKEIGDNK